MKRSALFVAIFLLAASVASAYETVQGNVRSTRTCNAESSVLLATGSIDIIRIIVASPTVNVDSHYAIFNATTGPVGGYNPSGSTAAFLSTAIDSVRGGALSWSVEYGVPLSSGGVVDKTGTSCIEALYRLSEPYTEYGPGGNPVGRTPTLPYNP